MVYGISRAQWRSCAPQPPPGGVPAGAARRARTASAWGRGLPAAAAASARSKLAPGLGVRRPSASSASPRWNCTSGVAGQRLGRRLEVVERPGAVAAPVQDPAVGVLELRHVRARAAAGRSRRRARGSPGRRRRGQQAREVVGEQPPSRVAGVERLVERERRRSMSPARLRQARLQEQELGRRRARPPARRRAPPRRLRPGPRPASSAKSARCAGTRPGASAISAR